MKRSSAFRNINLLLPLLLVILLLSSCADAAVVDACVTGEPAGFWKGLWHGLILIISFIISLFRDDVAVYAAHNTGALYDLGFILGILIMGGGSERASK